MLNSGQAKKLIIHVGQNDRYQSVMLYEAILRFLQQRGCAIVIVTKGIAGFGAQSASSMFDRMHPTEDLLVRIEVIESAEAIEALLPPLKEIATGALIELQDTEIVQYSHKPQVKREPRYSGVQLQGRAMMLRIYVDENDRYEGVPLHEAIVKRLKKADIAGATVLNARTGYGAKSRVHRRNLLTMGDNRPVVINVVDNEERIRQVLPELGKMVEEGLMVLSEVDVIKYSHMHDDEDRTIV